MAQTKSKRIFYFDALRAFAIIAVVLIHVFNTTQTMAAPGYATVPSLKWFVSCFLGATFRVGVPLFLMLSGALTLGRVWDIKSFLKKKASSCSDSIHILGIRHECCGCSGCTLL